MAAYDGLATNFAGYGVERLLQTPQNWSTSISDAVIPAPTSAKNFSNNIGPEDIEFPAGVSVSVNSIALNIENHETAIGGGFLNNHTAPTHIDAAGYDFFERVYISPISTSIKVLNSYDVLIKTLSTYRYQNINLPSITLDTGAGTSLTTEPSYAYAHNYGTYLNVVFTATAAGPSSYTGTVTFDYDTGDEVFDITIVRVIDAPWRPLDKFVESLEWKTSVIKARNLETRAALREHPRLSYDYEF